MKKNSNNDKNGGNDNPDNGKSGTTLNFCGIVLLTCINTENKVESTDYRDNVLES